MLAEFIDKLRSLARDADALDIRESTKLPDKVFVRYGDNLTMHDVPPPRRRHEVNGLADIVAAAKDAGMAESPEVFHNDGGIGLHLVRDERRDTVQLNPQVSDRFRALIQLAKGGGMQVRDAIRMLRFDLHGTGVEPLIQSLAKIDFTRRSDGASHVEHGRESLGKSVEAAVQQAKDVPEEFTVNCSVYMNPGLVALSAVSVRVGVYLDVHGETIEFRTLSDELVRATNQAQLSIGTALATELPGVPIFHGRP